MNKYFMGSSFIIGVVLFTTSIIAQTGNGKTIRVMNFNLWLGGDGCGFSKDSSIRFQLEAIRKAGADAVGFEEQADTTGEARAKILADRLGWNCYIISSSRAVISRFPVTPIRVTKTQPDNHHGSAGNNAQAVLLQINQKQQIVFGVLHLMYTPYEPYDIADKKLRTTQQAETSAKKSRLHEVKFMLEEIKPYLQKNIPIVLVGDFNEPSCLDWTREEIKKRNDKEIKFAVDWPASRLLLNNGFKDGYRTIYPDIKKRPGYTWTSKPGLWRTPEIHDRIDLVHITKNNIKATGAWVVGENSLLSDIIVEPWPSDHRAVVAELVIQ
jgi:exodeoxyribonuclease-3